MIESWLRSVRLNRPLALVGGMLAGTLVVLMTLRLIEHGFAFGQWLASRTP